MDSRAKKTLLVSPIDHAIRYSLRRQVERQNPPADTKQRLLRQAAERGLLKRLAAFVYGAEPEDFLEPRRVFDITRGWRELALVQVLRPPGSPGAFPGLLR